MSSPLQVLSPAGPLARAVDGFKPRRAQQEMAGLVAETLEDYATLVCEAGTGTGKTFAYLVPALLSCKRILVSTGTRHLQDQLFHRDLPVVRKALASPVRVALLKGRANYLCLHRLDQAHPGPRSRTGDSELQRVRNWAGLTRSGDIAELAALSETSPIWSLVTSTADNCLGQDCPRLNDCYVVKARREAAAADVVVVNHHLFLADMALRNEGFGEVLPGAEAVIFDEAHQLPEVSCQFFGVSLGSRQLMELARDSLAAQITEAPETRELREIAEHLETVTRDFRLALGLRERRAPWRNAAVDPEVTAGLESLRDALATLKNGLEAVAIRAKSLEHCARRCQVLAERLGHVTTHTDLKEIRWFETHGRVFTLHATPLDVSQAFRARLEAHKSAWVFTSATLAVGDDFGHFKARLGIEDAREARWDSPYDYARQGLIYLPEIPADPGDARYTECMAETVIPVLEASRGRAFLLFTSHRALKEAHGWLRGRVPYPLLVQGQAPRGELLERFRRAGNAVLLGTASFWEGVDVRGEALSCVIIDKLPFAPPDDPMTQARIEALREDGRNPFMEYQLPEAVIQWKQGVGRLIRDERDRGVLVLCDPRLRSRPYGRIFLGALPGMPCTRALADVRAFFGGAKPPVPAMPE